MDQVTGQIVVPDGEMCPDFSYSFLNLSVSIWSSKSPSLLPSKQRHSFPISFELPEVMPAPFMEQKSLVSVVYQLTVKFQRTGHHGESKYVRFTAEGVILMKPGTKDSNSIYLCSSHPTLPPFSSSATCIQRRQTPPWARS
jgi:hypothetical protein